MLWSSYHDINAPTVLVRDVHILRVYTLCDELAEHFGLFLDGSEAMLHG